MGLGAYRGKDAKLYRNTATNASPTWVEVENVRDLSLNGAWKEGDVSSRVSDFEMMLKTIMTVGVNFGMVKDLTDADYLAINASFWDPVSAIQFAIMNGSIATAGNRGVKMFCQVFEHSDEQNLEAGQLITVAIKPTRWVESGSLVLPGEHVVPS